MKSRIDFWSSWFALLIVFIPGSVHALPITYDESIHGDLVHGLPYDQTTNVGSFDIGTNTVTGSIFRPFSGGGDTSDAFNFTIPEGMALTTATLIFDVQGLANMKWPPSLTQQNRVYK